MRKQEKDFPSLGGIQEEEQKQKKPSKQIGYDKNSSVQLQGMNDFVGFYYEGNNAQQQQRTQQSSNNQQQNQGIQQENQQQGYQKNFQHNREQQHQSDRQYKNKNKQSYHNNQSQHESGYQNDSQQQEGVRGDTGRNYQRNRQEQNQIKPEYDSQNQAQRLLRPTNSLQKIAEQASQFQRNPENIQSQEDRNKGVDKMQKTSFSEVKACNKTVVYEEKRLQQEETNQIIQRDVNMYEDITDKDKQQMNYKNQEIKSGQNTALKQQNPNNYNSSNKTQNRYQYKQVFVEKGDQETQQFVLKEDQQQNSSNRQISNQLISQKIQINEQSNQEYVQKDLTTQYGGKQQVQTKWSNNQQNTSEDSQQYSNTSQQNRREKQQQFQYVQKEKEQFKNDQQQYVRKEQKPQIYQERQGINEQKPQQSDQQDKQYQTTEIFVRKNQESQQQLSQQTEQNSYSQEKQVKQNEKYQKKQNSKKSEQFVPKNQYSEKNEGGLEQNQQLLVKKQVEEQTEVEQRQDKGGKNSKGKGKALKGVTARQQEQKQQEISNEWNSDANKYVNEDQNFYLGEDTYFHQTDGKYTGKRSGPIQKILLVAEKPSISKSIADALSNGSYRSVKGYSKYLPIYEFEGNFRGNKAIFKVTSVAGHVYGLDYTSEYQNWNRVNPVKLFTAKTVKVESNTSGVAKHLEIEARDCSYLLLWLDNDREGENICFEVKSICERVMCFEGQNTVQVLRAKFSSLTKPDLIQAFNTIRDPPNMNEAKAADARQIIDLKIGNHTFLSQKMQVAQQLFLNKKGSAFTRYQTLFFRSKYPELNDNIISFGPCQTPTLGFCVAREDEIKNYKPRLYYRVRVTYFTEDKKEITSYYDKGHIFNQADANKIYQDIATQSQVTIESISSDNSSKQRPEGLNTVQLLKIASSYLHMSPMETMHVAEGLYLAGYITYPRTESTAYPKTFNFNEILHNLKTDSDYGKFAQVLLSSEYTKPRQGVDMGDHPPITPTTQYPSGLRGDEMKLYDYIARHFIASLSEDCKYKKIQITSKLQGYSFVARGVQMIKKGFLDVMDSASLGENAIASNLKDGDRLMVGNINLEQEYTQAPGYITESELIGLMEKNKIGTDASMATHIQNICNRNYVQINGTNRSLVPTELGRSLYHGYQKIDPDLVQPQIRAKIENLVDQIATGTKLFPDVINECLRIFQAKFLSFIENISKMDFLFGTFCTTFEDTLDAAKPFSKCGKCKRYMKVIEQAGKIICEKCDITLTIPTNGKCKLAGEKTCPLDGYQVIFFTSAHTPNVSFEFCPKCYSDSPLIEGDQVTCSICTNETCKLSINSRYLKECPICQVGDIVVEPQIAQKFAAMCNECWTQWCIPIQTKGVIISKEQTCKDCKSHLISFQHVVQQVKPTKPTENQGIVKEKIQRIIKFSKTEFVDVCLFCEPELKNECHQVEYHEPRRRRNQRSKKRPQ